MEGNQEKLVKNELFRIIKNIRLVYVIKFTCNGYQKVESLCYLVEMNFVVINLG
jgi:hypothetical protein